MKIQMNKIIIKIKLIIIKGLEIIFLILPLVEIIPLQLKLFSFRKIIKMKILHNNIILFKIIQKPIMEINLSFQNKISNSNNIKISPKKIFIKVFLIAVQPVI
jgi:hypothetical protein